MVLSNSLAKYRNSRISSFPRSCKKSSKFGTLENFFLAFFPPTSRQPSWTQKSTNSDSPTISNKMPVPLNHQIQLLQIQRTFRPIPKRQKRNQTKKDEKNQSFSTRISPSALLSNKNEWMRSEREKKNHCNASANVRFVMGDNNDIIIFITITSIKRVCRFVGLCYPVLNEEEQKGIFSSFFSPKQKRKRKTNGDWLQCGVDIYGPWEGKRAGQVGSSERGKIGIKITLWFFTEFFNFVILHRLQLDLPNCLLARKIDSSTWKIGRFAIK